MAGIGNIGGGYTPYSVAPPGPPVASNGRTPSGVLGTSAGLGETNSVDPRARDSRSATSNEATLSNPGSRNLTEDEQKQVDELKQRDQEVRRHEQAHVAAAGRYANGGPQFEFTTGPDGRQYATGGHVSIDVSPANTPEATIQKAQVIRRAALAPAEPSGQDRAVANAASNLERDARRQIQEARQAEAKGEGEDTPESTPANGAPEPATGAEALQPPPALPRRDFSEYQPPSRSSGGGSVGGATVRRLDVFA